MFIELELCPVELEVVVEAVESFTAVETERLKGKIMKLFLKFLEWKATY